MVLHQDSVDIAIQDVRRQILSSKVAIKFIHPDIEIEDMEYPRPTKHVLKRRTLASNRDGWSLHGVTPMGQIRFDAGGGISEG